MANKSSDKARKNIDVPTELHSLLGYKAGSSAASSSDVLELINFFAKEAAPSDFLQAFSKWTSDHEMLSDSIHVLQTVLRKGARFALNTELSGSLLRLRRARRHHLDNSIRHVPESHNKHEPSEHGPGEQTLWSMMSKGLVVIDK